MGSTKQDWSQYPVTVFFVDDQRSVTESMKKMLENVPFLDFHACNEPTQAINEILNIGPTIILLDIHMPILDGFDILEQLQNHEATQDIPVVILTVDTSSEAKNKAFQLGADDYLIKTPDKVELILRLRHHTRAYVDHLEREATLIALQNSKQKLKETIAKLELSSFQDVLTKIPNRRAFGAGFHREWQRSLRETIPLSLVLIDIDFFKQYNNHYGSLAGDDCLKEVAQSLKSVLKRPSDLVAYYGGDVFVALLPNTEAPGAICIAETLRQRIESLNFEHKASETFDIVTVSLGVVTTLPMIKHVPKEFIHMAGEALYKAKQDGRNRVVCKSI